LAFVFNKALWGVGVVAERRRQRAVARVAPIAGIAVIARDRKSKISTRRRGDAENSKRPEESHVIAVIARDRKTQDLTTKDTKEHKGKETDDWFFQAKNNRVT